VRLATVKKIHQRIQANKEKTVRIQQLEVSSIGYFKLKNGQTVRFEPKDVGKSVILETDLKNPSNQVLTFE